MGLRSESDRAQLPNLPKGLLFKVSELSINKAVDLLCIILIGLMFVSKLSLKWTKVIPYSIPPFIYQYGLHPYINFGLQALIFVILFFIWFRMRERSRMSLPYAALIYTMTATLIIQTVFQIVLVNPGQSAAFQLAGLGMALLLMFLYGIIIPSLFPIEKAVLWIKRFSVPLVIISVLLLPVLWGSFFRGGRFIGLFKHIPHMVSASTFAFIFFVPDIFKPQKFGFLKGLLPKLLALLGIFFAVFMTSTKAAFITVLITIFCSVFFFGSKSRGIRLFKFFFLTSALLGVLSLGFPVGKVFYEVATGQKSFGMRKAQNGIETRLEEITRGLEIFNQNPNLGKGLMFKFMNTGDAIGVSGYNSFKDPHNLFVSAGVIGGWPLMILSIFGFVLMFIGCFRGLREPNYAVRTFAIFLLAHIPVFVIYHAHFSLGGMGDRMYWLVFGYLGQRNLRPGQL